MLEDGTSGGDRERGMEARRPRSTNSVHFSQPEAVAAIIETAINGVS
jgi:hypothetical protein